MAGAFLIPLQREPVVCHAGSNCVEGEQEEAGDEGSSQAWDRRWITGRRGDGQVLLLLPDSPRRSSVLFQVKGGCSDRPSVELNGLYSTVDGSIGSSDLRSHVVETR